MRQLRASTQNEKCDIDPYNLNSERRVVDTGMGEVWLVADVTAGSAIWQADIRRDTVMQARRHKPFSARVLELNGSACFAVST